MKLSSRLTGSAATGIGILRLGLVARLSCNCWCLLMSSLYLCRSIWWLTVLYKRIFVFLLFCQGVSFVVVGKIIRFICQVSIETNIKVQESQPKLRLTLTNHLRKQSWSVTTNRPTRNTRRSSKNYLNKTASAATASEMVIYKII